MPFSWVPESTLCKRTFLTSALLTNISYISKLGIPTPTNACPLPSRTQRPSTLSQLPITTNVGLGGLGATAGPKNTGAPHLLCTNDDYTHIKFWIPWFNGSSHQLVRSKHENKFIDIDHKTQPMVCPSKSNKSVSIELFHQPTLMHNFLYSLTICLLHYPRHVSSINMPIFRRKNCIHTASGTAVRSQPVYCADVYRERRYQMLCEYSFSS